MARALIVGCGCRGGELGRALLEAGWQVRGTSRDPAALDRIEGAGIEAVLADPERVGTLLDPAGDATLVFWLLGDARGTNEALAALHGERLARLLEEVVDTPVRGLVYEAAGRTEARHRERGREVVRAATTRWRIPVEIVEADPAEWEQWRDEMVAAALRLVG